MKSPSAAHVSREQCPQMTTVDHSKTLPTFFTQSSTHPHADDTVMQLKLGHTALHNNDIAHISDKDNAETKYTCDNVDETTNVRCCENDQIQWFLKPVLVETSSLKSESDTCSYNNATITTRSKEMSMTKLPSPSEKTTSKRLPSLSTMTLRENIGHHHDSFTTTTTTTTSPPLLPHHATTTNNENLIIENAIANTSTNSFLKGGDDCRRLQQDNIKIASFSSLKNTANDKAPHDRIAVGHIDKMQHTYTNKMSSALSITSSLKQTILRLPSVTTKCVSTDYKMSAATKSYLMMLVLLLISHMAGKNDAYILSFIFHLLNIVQEIQTKYI